MQNQILDYFKNALNNGYSKAELKSLAINAIEKNDQTQFFSAIFGSEAKGNKFIKSLQDS